MSVIPSVRMKKGGSFDPPFVESVWSAVRLQALTGKAARRAVTGLSAKSFLDRRLVGHAGVPETDGEERAPA
jgi:hypothetical protein